MEKRRIRAAASFVLALAMVMSAVGCSSESTDTTASETAAESSAEAAVSEETAADTSAADESADTEAAEESADSEAAESAFPFELVTKDDQVVTFTKVPETVLSTNVNAGDELMALGLGDKIVGTCNNNSQVNPLYREEYETIPEFSEKAPSLEAILDLSPDFVYGRSSAFSEKNNTTHDTLSSYGIMSLSSIEGYKLGADLDDVYQDFYNLGRIFQVEDRAEEVVNGMKEKVAEVEKKIEGTEPVRVFVFDYLADDGPYTCGNNFTAQLIRHAGGENIFIDMDTTWATVSWESVIERDPEVIIINDYGSHSLEEKLSQLKDDPALSDISAIKNDRIISVTLCESFASSMTADTIEKFAKACHPECFEEE